ERETVIEALEHLQTDAPRFSAWLEELKKQISNDAIPCFVDLQATGTKRLVWETKNGVIFSGAFFEADTIAQEASVLKLIAGNGGPGKSSSHNGLAVLPGD